MLRFCPSHFLFFYHYRVPLDLHSFPTRRSSDLVADLGEEPVGVELRVLDRPASLEGKRVNHATKSGRPQVDRKSTRLNSSHTVISYAVFCLKKKTKHPTPAAQRSSYATSE